MPAAAGGGAVRKTRSIVEKGGGENARSNGGRY